MLTKPLLTGTETVTGQRSINMPVLSEMTEEECVEFIVKKGVTIPDSFIEHPKLGKIIKKIIQYTESYPNVPMAYNYDVAYYFAESIREAVNNYYGPEQRNSAAKRLDYRLQDSKVFTNSDSWDYNNGYWDEVWYSYNCYAYAIGRTEQPREYPPENQFHAFQYQPGDFAHTGIFDTVTTSIYDLAMIVKDDLQELKYNVSYVEDTPPARLHPHQKMICVRRGDEDYHFMKYNREDRYWYHKPSRNAPMQFQYQPSDKIWTNEYSIDYGENEGNTFYDSDIYYIVYTVPLEVIGSFEIIFDANKWSRNSGGNRNDVINPGPIGEFYFYNNGRWVLRDETIYNYMINFDPETDQFSDFLKWEIPPAITSYLADNALMIEVPLTVNLLFSNSQVYSYGSYSMDFMILGTGSGITRQDEDIVPDYQGLTYGAYPITVQPVHGKVTNAVRKIGFYDIFFNEYDLYQSRKAPNKNRGQFGRGKIGRFTLYANDVWTLSPEDEVISYIIAFNPATDSFFNALEWQPNTSSITAYIYNSQKAAKVPITVEYPAYLYSSLFLGSYSMEAKIFYMPIELLSCSDHVDVVEDTINFTPYPVWIYPAFGVMLPEEQVRGRR